ncbi:MAG: beta-propeller domain-containing protein, partial [Lachnospiraceae bacterium]|nr:beta-propeller domain-containing protein [Lachnospiraceae bacterium]
GIGYETDPESGRREGVKLSMFNISDPANVTEEAKYVLSTEDYSNALYAYKEVLIAPGRNLIGFASESYEEDEVQYNVFSYEDGSFVPKLKEEIRSMYNSRGLYSGNILYLVLGYDGIRSYDMDNGYAFVKERE